jgi:hypothetical protein
VIIHDFYIVRAPLFPAEAETPSIVDADAVLPLAVARQFFQVVAAGDAPVFQRLRGIQEQQFSERRALERQRELADALALKDALRVAVAEAADHIAIIT